MLIVRLTAGIQGVFVEDVVLEVALQIFLVPTFVHVSFVVCPFTLVVLVDPIFVQALPEVAANVLAFENEKNKSAAIEILRIFDTSKQYQEMPRDICPIYVWDFQGF